jgi:hypothetical protein
VRIDSESLKRIEAAIAEGRASVGNGARMPGLSEEVSEKDFQAAVLRLAKRNGWLAYHTHDSRKSAAGFPDLTLVRSGRILFAELKTTSGKTTADQDTWLEEIRSATVPAYLWRPADWAEIEKVLR